MKKKTIEAGSNQGVRRGAGACSALRNERGIALIIALVMLTLLGMLGIFALGTSSTSLHIAGNYRNHELAFYNADMGEAFGPNNVNITGMINPYNVNISTPPPPVTGAYLGQTQVTVQYLCVSESLDHNMHEFHYKVTITGTGANNARFTTVSQMRRAIPKVKIFETREDC